MRFSRAILLLGALWGYISMTGLRLVFNFLGFKSFKIGDKKNRRHLVVGDKVEAERVAGLLTTIESQPSFIGLVSVSKSVDPAFTGNIDDLDEIVDIYKINEIIFCAQSIPSRRIIDIMSGLKTPGVEFKIAPPESLSLIGSNSINTAGDLYTMEINSIGKYTNRRNKRFLDFTISLLLIPALPVMIFLVRKPAGFISNLFQVLFAQKTWVGYCKTKSGNTEKLPDIRSGVLNPANALNIRDLKGETLDRLNMLYARDYHIKTDLDIIFKAFRSLGND
jgi:hypothetical protein